MRQSVINKKKKIFHNQGLLEMKSYTKEQRVFIAEYYFQSNEGMASTIPIFRIKYGRNSNPTSAIMKIIEKVQEGRIN